MSRKPETDRSSVNLISADTEPRENVNATTIRATKHLKETVKFGFDRLIIDFLRFRCKSSEIKGTLRNTYEKGLATRV